MIFAPLLVLCSLQSKKPPTWTELKLGDGITVSSPVSLKLSVDKEEKSKSKGKPADKSKPIIKADPKDERTWVGEADDGAYFVSIETLSSAEAADTSELLTAFALSILDKDTSEIVGERDLVVQGWPALAITIQTKGSPAMAYRVVRYGNQLISVMGMYDPSGPRPPSFDRFLNSLHFPKDGDLTTAGPTLERFPLDGTGLSCLFPRKPERSEDTTDIPPGAGPMVIFESDYGLRTFTVAYRDLAAGASVLGGSEFADARSQVTKDLLAGLGGRAIKKVDEKIGSDQVLLTDFVTKDKQKGKTVAYIHEGRLIVMIENAPAGYEDPKTVDLFIRSIESVPVAAVWTKESIGHGITVASPVKLKKIAVPLADKGIADKGIVSSETWGGNIGATALISTVTVLKPDAKSSDSQALTESAAGFVNRVQGHVVAEFDLLLQGWHGIGLIVNMPSGISMTVHLYIVGDAIVSLSGTYRTGEQPSNSLNQFLGSVHVPLDGKATENHPPLVRFPLGSSGLTALFPCEPKHPEESTGKGSIKKSMHGYVGTYCGRMYIVSYTDSPSPIGPNSGADEIRKEEGKATALVLSELQGKVAKQAEDHIGKDLALTTEFNIESGEGDKASGRMLLIFHGGKEVALMTLSGDKYEDPETIDKFLHSIEFNP